MIARGRRVRRPREQREVAFGLADMSTHPDVHVKMVQKGAVRSLMTLLEKAQDAEAQRFSALALGNISSTPENRIPIVEEGVLKPVIRFMETDDADIVARQYCALTVKRKTSRTRHAMATVLTHLFVCMFWGAGWQPGS